MPVVSPDALVCIGPKSSTERLPLSVMQKRVLPYFRFAEVTAYPELLAKLNMYKAVSGISEETIDRVALDRSFFVNVRHQK